MNAFTYLRASSASSAVELFAGNAAKNHFPRFLAGGTNLVDLMREGVETPPALIDITRTPLAEILELPNGDLRIGALVRNSHLAAHPLVRDRYPLVSQAILNGASAQLRNMATTGGNIMQRTRCYYFYDAASHCNKRAPGSGCDAMAGFNRIHAVLGTSPYCIASHPSDMCVALIALDAKVNVTGAGGERTLRFDEVHRLPGETPHIETNLQPGELITSVDLPASAAGLVSAYRKVRDRASYAFALVSVAGALKLEDGVIRDLRLALGGVGTKPWRAAAAEEVLRGSTPTPDLIRSAAAAEMAAAIPRLGNAFKIELARRTIAAVIQELAAKETSGK